MKLVHEILRKTFLYLRSSCQGLRVILHLWRRFARAIHHYFLSDQNGYFPREPESPRRATNVILPSRLPVSYSLDEHGQLAGRSQGSRSAQGSMQEPSATHSHLALETQAIFRRQSTSQTLTTFGTATLVSSPITMSPQGSIPLPYNCTDNAASDASKFRVATPSRNRRYNTRVS